VHSSSRQKKSSHAPELNHLDGPVRVAVAQQLQEYKVKLFGDSAANTLTLTAPGEVTIGFGYPTPPHQADLCTFTSYPVSTSLTSTHPFGWKE
jgi:hypothetical protein